MLSKTFLSVKTPASKCWERKCSQSLRKDVLKIVERSKVSLLDLPLDVLRIVIKNLDYASLFSVYRTCSLLRREVTEELEKRLIEEHPKCSLQRPIFDGVYESFHPMSFETKNLMRPFTNVRLNRKRLGSATWFLNHHIGEFWGVHIHDPKNLSIEYMDSIIGLFRIHFSCCHISEDLSSLVFINNLKFSFCTGIEDVSPLSHIRNLTIYMCDLDFMDNIYMLHTEACLTHWSDTDEY